MADEDFNPKAWIAGFLNEKPRVVGTRGSQERTTTMRTETSKQMAIPQVHPAVRDDRMGEVISEGRLVVSPQLAREILDHMQYDKQRRIQGHYVSLYAESMRRGRFTPGTQLAFGRLNGWPHLVNGQHRINAVIESGLDCVFQVLLVDVASEQELAALYYRFDVDTAVRNTHAILNAVGIAEKYGISKQIATSVLSAATWIKSGFSRPDYIADPYSRSIDTRFDNAEPWWDVAKMIDKAFAPAETTLKRRMMTASVMSVALITFRHQKTLAWDFWNGIAVNDALKRKDPRNTLITALYDRPASGQSLDARSAIPAVAWNAFYKKSEIGFIRVGDAKNVRISGTPYVIGEERRK